MGKEAVRYTFKVGNGNKDPLFELTETAFIESEPPENVVWAVVERAMDVLSDIFEDEEEDEEDEEGEENEALPIRIEWGAENVREASEVITSLEEKTGLKWIWENGSFLSPLCEENGCQWGDLLGMVTSGEGSFGAQLVVQKLLPLGMTTSGEGSFGAQLAKEEWYAGIQKGGSRLTVIGKSVPGKTAMEALENFRKWFQEESWGKFLGEKQ